MNEHDLQVQHALSAGQAYTASQMKLVRSATSAASQCMLLKRGEGAMLEA
jgi:hypothetical protein